MVILIEEGKFFEKINGVVNRSLSLSIKLLCDNIQMLLELYSKHQAEKMNIEQKFPCHVKTVRDKIVFRVLVF